MITLPTDLRKATTYELVRVLSNHIYDQAMSDERDETWESMRKLVDELEYRVTTEIAQANGKSARLN
jgi:hypothetical protein